MFSAQKYRVALALGVIVVCSIFVMSRASLKNILSITLDPVPSQTQSASIADFDSNLIAHWTFEEGSGGTALDITGRGNNATLLNGAGWAPGKFGSSLSIVASNSLALVRETTQAGSGMTDLFGASPVTITAWIYALSYGSTGNQRGDIIYSGTNGFRVRGGSNNLEFSNNFFQSPIAGSTRNSIELNKWTFVAVTRNADGSVTFYVDGQVSGIPNQDASSFPVSVPGYQGTCIGIKCHSNQDTFDGKIDELRIYNRVLTASEIQDIYAGIGAISPSLPTPATTPPSPEPVYDQGQSFIQTEPPVQSVIQPIVSSGNWYVDSDVGTSGNGTSWTVAYKSFGNINWNLVNPGDTIWVSGGIYAENISVTKNGTPDRPITIKSSREAGHNNVVSIRGSFTFASTAKWVNLDGAKSDNFSTDNITVQNLSSIKDNINIEISNPLGSGLRVVGGSSGHRIRWLSIHDNGAGDPTKPQLHGILINADRDIDNIDIGYSHIWQNYEDGINMAGSEIINPGSVKLHHLIIERIADDGVFLSGGADLSYSIIGGRHPFYNQGHPDIIQVLGGGSLRIYNNILIGERFTGQSPVNALIYFESTTDDVPQVFIYGNVGYVPALLTSYGFSFGVQWMNGDPTMATWDKLVVANNTIVGAPGPGIDVWNYYRGSAGGVNIDPLTINSGYFVNNLIWNAGMNTGADNVAAILVRGPARGIQYTTSNFRMDYNLIAGRTDDVTFRDIDYETPALFNTATGFVGNTNAIPSFINSGTFDFRLSSTDVAARNRGVRLDTYLPPSIIASMPDYSRDLYGGTRGVEGLWDIGAFETVNGSLISSPSAVDGSNIPVSTLGDFNHDGLVNTLDFSLLVSSWNQPSTTYDLNGDGLVNTLDYAIMAQHWSR